MCNSLILSLCLLCGKYDGKLAHTEGSCSTQQAYKSDNSAVNHKSTAIIWNYSFWNGENRTVSLADQLPVQPVCQRKPRECKGNLINATPPTATPPTATPTTPRQQEGRGPKNQWWKPGWSQRYIIFINTLVIVYIILTFLTPWISIEDVMIKMMDMTRNTYSTFLTEKFWTLLIAILCIYRYVNIYD